MQTREIEKRPQNSLKSPFLFWRSPIFVIFVEKSCHRQSDRISYYLQLLAIAMHTITTSRPFFMHSFTSISMLIATLPFFKLVLFRKSLNWLSFWTRIAVYLLEWLLNAFKWSLLETQLCITAGVLKRAINLNLEQLRSERIILISVDLVLPRWYIICYKFENGCSICRYT